MKQPAVLERATLAICAVFLFSECGPERPRPEHAVLGAKLTLRGFHEVTGFDVFTADLGDDSGGLSSSGFRTRNVLFVESSGEARWLLPDSDHVVAENRINAAAVSQVDAPVTLAVVALATPVQGDAKVGDLYLYDPPGRHVERIADGVTAIHGASVTRSGIAILYERPTGYVLAHYDAVTLTRIREVDVTVPAIMPAGAAKR